MGIIGHKERALIRRGLYVQEALKRRDLIIEDDQLDLFDNKKSEKIKIYEIITESGNFRTKVFREIGRAHV